MPTHSHSRTQHRGQQFRVLWIAIALLIIFAIIEVGTGYWSGSLTLMSDAGHMGSDAVALSIAVFAIWLARRPPSAKHSYGLGRAEIIAAWISSLLLLFISILIIIEAVRRFSEPIAVKGLPVIIVASIGLAVNLVIAWLLARGTHLKYSCCTITCDERYSGFYCSISLWCSDLFHRVVYD